MWLGVGLALGVVIYWTFVLLAAPCPWFRCWMAFSFHEWRDARCQECGASRARVLVVVVVMGMVRLT